ncbi:MAG: hypothetical protein EOO38_27620 [Cytophagaceae bacterium]|nr:MAG: hypothetical protein EOO38_27620 [Cytophagaceae bacterium]
MPTPPPTFAVRTFSGSKDVNLLCYYEVPNNGADHVVMGGVAKRESPEVPHRDPKPNDPNF